MCDWSSSVGLAKRLSVLEANSPSLCAPLLSTRSLAALHSSTNRDTYLFESHVSYHRSHSPPRPPPRNLNPTCRALPAARGSISRTVPRRGLALPEQRLSPRVGEGARACGDALQPPWHLAAGEGRGAPPLPKIARSARGSGLLSERLLPARPAGRERADGGAGRGASKPPQPRAFARSLFFFPPLNFSFNSPTWGLRNTARSPR